MKATKGDVCGRKKTVEIVAQEQRRQEENSRRRKALLPIGTLDT